MRIAIERLTDPLLGWIPDVTPVAPSRQMALGATLSIVLHLLLFLLFLGAALVFPSRVERAPVAAQPNLEVTIMPMNRPAPEPRLKPPPPRQFVDANGLKAGEKPKEATLEADRDMTEASELPARGESPLPTQDGEKLPFMRDFADQDIRLQASDFATRLDPSPAETPQPPQAAPQAATVAPMYAPQPVAKEALAAAEKAAPEQKLPEPAKQTRATPAPLPKVVTPTESQLAMAQPKPESAAPPPVPNAREVPQVRPAPNEYANWSTPKPLAGPTIADRYKEELRKTKNEGRISTRGVSGVNAINTPAGRWRKRMFEAMKQNWSLFVHQNPDLITIGTVRVKFTVGREGGRPTQVRVESDGGNNTSAQISLRAVVETPIPPPPPDLFENLEGEKLEAEVIFTLY